jgi:hypothetical protein
MKIILTSIALIIFFFEMHGQSHARFCDISNKITKKHVRIPGTHLYLIPSNDFTIAKAFIGLTNDKNSNIVVLDIFGSNFYSQVKDFSKATFEKTGLIVYEEQEFKINGFNAKSLYTNSLNSTEKNLMLAYGDSTFTILITATFHDEGKKTYNNASKCMLSAVYDKAAMIDPFETAKFELDLSKSDFKFQKSVSGLFFYSFYGNDSTAKALPFFVVSQMPYQDATDEILKLSTKQMIDKAREYGINDLNLDFKKIEINGCHAIETKGYGIKNGEKVFYYLLTVGKPGNVIVINSLIQNDYEIYLKKISDAVYTIKLK